MRFRYPAIVLASLVLTLCLPAAAVAGLGDVDNVDPGYWYG
jgi:hypothetical protein